MNTDPRILEGSTELCEAAEKLSKSSNISFGEALIAARQIRFAEDVLPPAELRDALESGLGSLFDSLTKGSDSSHRVITRNEITRASYALGGALTKAGVAQGVSNVLVKALDEFLSSLVPPGSIHGILASSDIPSITSEAMKKVEQAYNDQLMSLKS